MFLRQVRREEIIKRPMTLMQIRSAGLQALARELGPVGMVRFLQQYETGKGDYARDRHEWLDGLDAQTIANEMLGRRKTGKTSK